MGLGGGGHIGLKDGRGKVAAVRGGDSEARGRRGAEARLWGCRGFGESLSALVLRAGHGQEGAASGGEALTGGPVRPVCT